MSEGAAKALFGAPAAGVRLDPAARFAAFEQDYERYKDLVRRTAYSLGGSEDLDDIVQDCFVRLWKAWDSFRGEAGRRTWVYRVTVNGCREHWRRRGRYKAAVARYSQEPRPWSAPGGQDQWALSQRVAQALQALSFEQRETVTLCYLEGLSLAEAAQALDLPEGTIKSRLHHARRILAGFLQAEQTEGKSHG